MKIKPLKVEPVIPIPHKKGKRKKQETIVDKFSVSCYNSLRGDKK